MICFFFFFKQKTAYERRISDWSSDVCSSDLSRVASGTAAVIAAELNARVAVIDAALMQPGLPPQRQSELWRERVRVLRAFTGFESNRQIGRASCRERVCQYV